MEIETSSESTKKQDMLYKMDKIKLMECIREFHLPQQFPSTTKQADLMTWTNKNITNRTLKISNNFKLLPRADRLIPCKKLRIVSSKGRDLGVFNVEVRNDHNSSKEKILKITKSDTFKPVSKAATISLSSVLHTPRTLPRITEQETVKIPKYKLVNITFNDKHVSNGDWPPPKLQSTTVPIKETITCDRNSDINKKTCDDDTNVDKSFISDKKKSEPCIDNIVNINWQKYGEMEHKPVVSTKNNKYLTEDVNPWLKIHKVTKNNEISLASRSASYKKIAESPFPIVRCKKLAINCDSNCRKMHFKIQVQKEKCSVSSGNTGNEETFTLLDNMSNSTQKHNQTSKDLSKRDTDSKSAESHGISADRNNSSQIKNSGFVNLINENEPISETKIQKDIMTIIPNHESLLFYKNTISTSGQTIIASSESNKNMTNMAKLHNEVTCDTNHIISNNSQTKDISIDGGLRNGNSLLVDVQYVPSELEEVIDIMNVQPNEKNVHCSKNSCEKDLSARWDIIKTAVSSVKDDKLRVQALKALADCGIGIERRVPIHPPERLKTVHDTQVQTTIFGLLDPKSFVLINKDLDSIQRISQVTFHDISCTQNMLENNLHPCNDSLSKTPNLDMIEQESVLDIDKFLREFCEENSSALKVKETLSTINTRYKKILDQLQKDFESVKKYDQDGMLNIHNAIIRNNIFDVQRHLMILKHRKENVDIPTEDGVTGLELAIKYDVRSQIVKLLLEAGARPMISEPAHESALIIAGKKSSALLPMLVKHISNSGLLNQIDEEGFTTLHYCCMYGNLEGVNALISSGANINLKDMKSGRTPVFHALENNHAKIVQVLLHAGAVATAANFAGQSPIPTIIEAKNVSFKVLPRKELI